MDITKRLMQLDPSLELHDEGFWKDPYRAFDGGYSSFNDAGICIEDGEFLYAMIRILKPSFVLETGTHWGVGASYMGQALKDNKKGVLETVEFLPEIYQKAKKRIQDMQLQDQVILYLMDVANFIPTNGTRYKLILLDTEPQTRFSEAVKFYEFLEPGGFMFIHDLHQHMHQVPNEEHGFAWPYGRIPFALRALVLEEKLRPFHFETPRGLTGFYKPHPQDYHWHTPK